MKELTQAGFLFLALCIALESRQPVGAAEPAGPATLWSFLGIPQGIQKIQDASINTKGGHPGLERKPPLKRIADPANLESSNPMIKAAAKIKTEEDLAQQKIKAIKYLATIGCGCYPGVKDALLAALDDCTEEVRYEGAKAFCEAAGNPCKQCNQSGCCAADVMTKLREMAYGQDDKCCFTEPSARVRAMAASALKRCQQIHPPGPKPAAPAGGGELPIEAPLPEPKPGEVPVNPVSATDAGKHISLVVNPVSLTRLPGTDPQEATANATLAGKLTLVSGSNAACVRCGICGGTACGPNGCRYGRAGAGAMPGGTAAPSETGEAAAPSQMGEAASAGQPSAPAPNSLASAFGAASGPQSIAPNMIGDSLGNGMTFSAISYSEQHYGQEVVQGNVPIAGGDRNFKIADNNSPIPTDRVLFNYNHFQNALIGWPGGQNYNLDRFTFGVEKTFCNKTCSLEVRVPFARGLEGDQELTSDRAVAATEFGNIPLVFKKLLVRREHWLLSAGMATVFPTGSDARVYQDGVLTKWVKNDAYHLQPFLGWLWLPNDQLFVEAFAQLDFDANGYPVIFNDPTGTERLASGVLQDQSLMLVDLKIGRWIYRNPCAPWIKGIAPAIELHYTTTMQDADRVGNADNPQIGSIGNFYNRMDILNITGGLHFALGKASELTVAAVAPLRSEEESIFDAEVAVQYNRWF